MISQATLDSVYVEKIAQSFSDPDHPHLLQKIDGRWSCGCRGFEQWGHCEHASKEIQADATKTKDLCAIIMDLKSFARYKNFEDVMAHFAGTKDDEYVYIMSVALGISMSKPVCADDLHYASRERFKHSPKIIGTALQSLRRQGLLEIIGDKKSERDACHHRKICIFAITEAGRKYLLDGGVA